MKIGIASSVVIALSAIAALTDMKYRKVKNIHLLMALLLGVCLMLWQGQISDLSLKGLIIPFVLHYIPFKLRVVHAGDVKLFMVIGLFLGPVFVVGCIVWSYLAGGTAALLIMLKRGILMKRLIKLGQYLKEIMLLRTPIPYISDDSKQASLPFALMIHIGVLFQMAVEAKGW